MKLRIIMHLIFLFIFTHPVTSQEYQIRQNGRPIPVIGQNPGSTLCLRKRSIVSGVRFTEFVSKTGTRITTSSA